MRGFNPFRDHWSEYVVTFVSGGLLAWSCWNYF